VRVIGFLFTVLLLWSIGCSSGGDGEVEFILVDAFPFLRFSFPVDLQHPGDGTNRLFVVEKRGRVIVFKNDVGTKDAGVFLDIRDKVIVDSLELGAQAIAFHPDFEDNGYFYFSYTPDDPIRSIVSRFSVSEDDPNVADPESELIIMELLQPDTGHNLGMISFGPDGYLYIGSGDGGPVDGIPGTGQNTTDLFGAVLRIDVDNPDEGMNYGIPASNPFAGNTLGIKEEIYAYGFRNPWRFSWDTVTGLMWLADVGQHNLEEIDIIEKGANYGWKIMEGSMCFDPPVACDETGLTLPIFEYDHTVGIAIIGGFVYRGAHLSELIGSYIYGDFLSGKVWALEFDGEQTVSNSVLINSPNLIITTFGVDQNQELYVCTLSVGLSPDRIKKIVRSGEDN